MVARRNGEEGDAGQSEGQVPRALCTRPEGDAARDVAGISNGRWVGAAVRISRQAGA